MANNNQQVNKKKNKSNSEGYLMVNDKLFNRYVILNKLTTGGMNSVIYTAKNITADSTKLNDSKKARLWLSWLNDLQKIPTISGLSYNKN